jgi:acyl-CoA thioester hydrolase
MEDQVKKEETSDDWFSALMPTLALAKDYEPGRRNEGFSGGHTHQWDPEPETLETVRFSDCDPFGHLNNARYFDYFVNARDQHLSNAYKVDLALHAMKHQESWVVREHRIVYLKPARIKEQVRIRSRLLDYDQNETFVESLMLNQEGRSLKALLWSRYSYVNIKTGRSARHPDYILEVLKATRIEASAYRAKDFELRLKNVMEELRRRKTGPEKS